MNKLYIKKIGELLIFIGMASLLFVFFYWLFYFTYYIHESGHIIFGFFDGLIKGQIIHFEIGNLITHPLTPFIPLPQQIKIVGGGESLNFVLGGPFFNIIIFSALSFLGYKLSGNKTWFLLFLSIFLFEISGNIICGTDNFYSQPLLMCVPALNEYLLYFSIFLFSGTLTWFSVKRLGPYITKVFNIVKGCLNYDK